MRNRLFRGGQTHQAKAQKCLGTFEMGEKEVQSWREKQPKASGLALCSLRRLQSLEGFQSTLGEFINRKTNSWHALCLFCLSQGCNINFPASKALQAKETFCEFRAFPPVSDPHVAPFWENISTASRGAAEAGAYNQGPENPHSPNASSSAALANIHLMPQEQKPRGVYSRPALQNTQRCLSEAV